MNPVRFPRPVRYLCLVVAAFCALSSFTATTEVSLGQETVNFETDIKPLLEKHCIRCHGPEDQQNDFRIDDREAVMDGYIVEGDWAFSDLYHSVSTTDEEDMMPPPDEGGPLSEKQIELIKNWIVQGADWPETVKLELVEEVVEEVKEEIAEEQQAEDAQNNNWQLFTEITGLLHPMVLHFPVALLMGGALFALFGFRGESPLSDAAYYCLWLGALTAIFACVSGWFFAIDKNQVEWQSFDLNKSIDVHRWGGIAVAALAFILALIASSSRRRDPYGSGALWKLCMIGLACLTGYVAHHGGKMTHDGLHDKLFNKSNQLYENLTGEEKAAPAVEDDAAETGEADDAKSDDEVKSDNSATDDAKGDAAEGTGETSTEGDEKQDDEKQDEGKQKDG